MEDSLIHKKYLELGKPKSLGEPLDTEDQVLPDDARVRHYEKGRIYPAPKAGRAHVLLGEILEKWEELETDGVNLGYPITDERLMSDGVWRYSEFNNGIIYRSPETGAHAVRGIILDKYRVFGGPLGVLGYPTSDEADIGDGRFNQFEHGGIYWRKDTGAFVVHGEIHKKWMDQGGATGATFGFPISDELPSPGMNTRFNKFENGQLSRIISSTTTFEVKDTAPEVLRTQDRDVDLLKDDDKTHRGRGFRILSLSLYGNPTKPLATCVWVKDGGPEQKVLFKGSSDDLQDFLTDPANDDFRATIISATGPANKAVFALVCEKRKGPAPVLRSKLVAGPGPRVSIAHTRSDRRAFVLPSEVNQLWY